MPKIVFPIKNNQWQPLYTGDFFGDMVETFNLNFSKSQGKISASLKLYPYTVTQDFTIGLPTQFIYSDLDNASGVYKYYAVSDKIYMATSIGLLFAADTLTASPTSLTDSDMIIHGKSSVNSDIVIVGVGTDLYRFNRDVSVTTWSATWWTVGLAQTSLNSSYPIIMKTFGNAPVLFILNYNQLHSVRTPGTNAIPAASSDVQYNRLVFKAGYQGNWMVTTNEKIYIGLKDNRGNTYPSLVEEYDPFAETVREIKVQEGATIGFLNDNILNIINIRGELKSFTGNAFQTYASFPSAFIDGMYINLPHRNGIAIVDDKIQILMPTQGSLNITSAYDFYMHGGVWIYDREFQRLYHSVSPVNSKTIVNGVGVSQLAGGALFDIGNGGGTTSGYYFAGITTSFIYGGTFTTGIYSNYPSISGVSVATDMWGYFKTQKIKSPEIETNWRNLLVKYTAREFPTGAGTGTIIVKYRTIDTPNLIGIGTGSVENYAQGQWTITNATQAFLTIHGSAVTNVAVGDEMFIWQGIGNGVSADIVSISIVGSTATLGVAIDNTEINLSGSGAFLATFENWKTISPSITNNSKSSQLLDIPESQSEWIQFKVILKKNIAIDELQVGFQNSLRVEE